MNIFYTLIGFISSQLYLDLANERQFLQWMRTNNKFFTGDDYHLRFGIFMANKRYCQDFNKRIGLTYRLDINQFACFTQSEYKSLLGVMNNNHKIHFSTIKKSFHDIPDSFDWRDKGVVNQIKNQGDCGSCWAFSVITTSESAFAIQTGKLLQFSEQNILDCAPCFGCRGGWTNVAFDYLLNTQNGTFNSEEQYPYTAVDGNCVFDSTKAVGKVTQVINVIQNDENDLKEKIAMYGVASISIHSGNTQFMMYSEGILDDDACIGEYVAIDHAVGAVGYGTENGIDFWIVRNSWGTSWGEEGYVRMIRNKNNKCYIASEAYVAIDSE